MTESHSHDRSDKGEKHPKKRGFFAAMRSLISGDDGENAAHDHRSQTHHAARPTDEDHWVSLSLEQLLETDPEALLHIISLKAFRESIGPVWDRVSEKVLLIAEGTLRQHVGGSAKIRQHGKDMFLLFFPHLSADAGRKRAFEVSVALGQKLVGAKFQIIGGPTGLGVGLASLPGNQLLGEDGTLDEGALLLAGDTAEAIADDQGTGGWKAAGPDASAIPTLQQQDRNEPVYGENKWTKLEKKDDKPQAGIRLVPLTPPARPKKPEPQWVPISRDK